MSMLKRFALCLTLCAAAMPALAQKLTPGLWETTMNLTSGGRDMGAEMARMKEQMARMPPEQRKMMEDMMAKQGVSMGAGGPTSSFRYCIGAEQAERGEVPQDADGRCKRDSIERSGATTRFKFSCTNPASSGTGEFTLSGDKAFTMKMAVDRMEQGKAQHLEMQQNGKWVGADCGKLKPRAVPGK